MKTTSKTYKIRLYFAAPVERLAENGVVAFRISAKSPKGAEKVARQHAAICSQVADVVKIEVEYKTTAGLQVRTVQL